MDRTKKAIKFAYVHKFGKSRKRKRTAKEDSTMEKSSPMSASKRKLSNMSPPPKSSKTQINNKSMETNNNNLIISFDCLNELVKSSLCPECKVKKVTYIYSTYTLKK